MAVRTKVEAIDRDIAVIVSDTLSPAAQSKALAQFAAETIEAAARSNRQVLGRDAARTIYVDGRKDAPLASVKPDGVVVAEFEISFGVLEWIWEQLQLHSPRALPDPNPQAVYSLSHRLLADGVDIALGSKVPAAQVYEFVNVVPYAGKIELGSSSQAPDGVYQAVAVLADRIFANMARVSFSYRASLPGAIAGHTGRSSKYPSIMVKLR